MRVHFNLFNIFFSIVFSMSDMVDKFVSPRRSAFLSYFTNRYRCRLTRSDNKKLWNNMGPMLWLLHGSVCAQVHLRV
uniref:Putative secreted protein n=1 Tax=Ixodes scapularis TaxID=6945 RepID=A0A4D5RXU9_IXOSC